MTEHTLLPKVLLIDDDTSLCVAYTVLLEDDFGVTTALTGAAGVAHVQREALSSCRR
jgi:hypothetical protein